jgi:hypothetical protein
MATTTATYRIHAIPSSVLDTVRSTNRDVSGNHVERITAEGDEALRCCLRNARPGEALILFGYEPPLPTSPYREVGAVIAHAQPCPGPQPSLGSPDGDRYPPDWYGRPQVLRAYDERGWIREGKLHDGQDPESVIAELLADPEVVQIHSRNVTWGCYMFTVTAG